MHGSPLWGFDAWRRPFTHAFRIAQCIAFASTISMTGACAAEETAGLGTQPGEATCRAAAERQMSRAQEEQFGLLTQYDIYDHTLADCRRWYQASSDPFPLPTLPCPSSSPARANGAMAQLCRPTH